MNGLDTSLAGTRLVAAFLLDETLASNVAVIATLLALAFGAAAMVNSYRRRKAARDAYSSRGDDRPYKIADPFSAPAPMAAPFAAVPPIATPPIPAPAPTSGDPAPPAPASTPARGPITAFRQLDSHGAEVSPSANDASDTYVWE